MKHTPKDVPWMRAAIAAALLTLFAAGGAAAMFIPLHTTYRPGMQPSLATTPIVAASLTPAASPTPSAGTPSPSAGNSSPAPTPPPPISTGSGQWTVSGATIKAGGAFAMEIDSGGSDFNATVSAAHGSWSARYGISGEGPISAQGLASGPSPLVIDATVQVFRLPISVHGTPGKDLSVSVGTPSAAAPLVMVPAASVRAQAPLAESPEQTALRIVEDTIRAAVAFTLVGWLLLLIAPGLRARTYRSMQSRPLRRLGLGAILALDVPLAALLVAIIGVPLGLWWIGLVALAIFVAVAVAGYAFAGFQIGALLLSRSGGGARLMWMVEVPLGVALLVLAGQIPYAGPVISIVAVVYGIGSMLYSPAEPEETAISTDASALVPAKAPSLGSPQKPLVD